MAVKSAGSPPPNQWIAKQPLLPQSPVGPPRKQWPQQLSCCLGGEIESQPQAKEAILHGVHCETMYDCACARLHSKNEFFSSLLIFKTRSTHRTPSAIAANPGACLSSESAPHKVALLGEEPSPRAAIGRDLEVWDADVTVLQ